MKLTIPLILVFSASLNAQVVKITQDIHEKITYKDAEVTKHYGLNGSGIVVGNNETDTYVLTCRHVHHADYEKYPDIKIISNGYPHMGKIVKTFYLADLALIKVDNLLLPAVKLAKEPLKVGDYANYKGFPDGGKEERWRRGIVKSIDDKIDFDITGAKTVYLDLQAVGGESGSGVLNSKGELVGIVCARSPTNCHVIGLPEIQKFLDGEIK